MKTFNAAIFANPFYCYILSFGTGLFVYTWGWSGLYPPLSTEVVTFLLSSFVISGILGYRLRHYFAFKPIPVSKWNGLIVTGIVLGYIAEFIYNKGIPLVLVATGADYWYQDFGIPTFHVFLQTFAPFYTAYTFHQYLSSGRKRLLIYVLILLPFHILIVSRGALMIVLMSCFALYMAKVREAHLKTVLKVVVGFLFVFYLFGYVGAVRSFKDNEDFFLEIAEASEGFKNSPIPKEYFWFYIYVSSTIANFQNVADKMTNPRQDVLFYMGHELEPDFITKRIMSAPDLDNPENYLIAPFLTAGTLYYDSQLRMGWSGTIFIYFYYTSIILFYTLFLKKNSIYYHTGTAILCTMSIFHIFDNMIRFTGLSFQLFYPLAGAALSYVRFHVPTIRFKLN